MKPVAEHTVALSLATQGGVDVGIRLLALVVDASGDEAYHVVFRTSSTGTFRGGVMTHAHGDAWHILENGTSDSSRLTWTSPNEVFALALGPDATADSSDVSEAAPHWPATVVNRLLRRRLSGPGTVAFDAAWFLAELTTSALDYPILLPNAASKLGLTGLERATVMLALATAAEQRESAATGLAALLTRALHAELPTDPALAWGGDGRLIGEFHGGELAQLGTNIDDGCRAALGTGPLQVVFTSPEPLGLGLGPLLPTDTAASAGAGCVVGEVDPGGAAERAGVTPGMALSHLWSPTSPLSPVGPDALSFEGVLDAIDTRRSVGGPLTITFDTASPVTHLYAVEMPAGAVLHALAAVVDEAPWPGSRDVGVGASFDALCGHALLWREDTPRLFLGEAGSVTEAHTDMCPQVQMAHALVGTKLLGVASHHATPRLRAEHAPDSDEHGPTRVPTDRPLTARESQLVSDPEMTTAVLRAGDLAVFDSGALHFASSGAEAISGALYHGLITPAAIPRLRLAAAAHSKSPAPAGDGYSDHLYAPELLRLVEQRLDFPS